MGKRAKGLFWGGVAVFLFAAGIRLLTKLSDPGYAYSKNRDFIEHSDSYDVLFFGNSHMANGVFPMELWNDYGIVSYNLAGFGLPMPAIYWVMKNALDESEPALVIIDCYNLASEEKAGRKEMLHAQTDHLPLSFHKIQMINDLIEEPGERLEFIWNFAAYHDRWWDLDQADFEGKVNVQKGAEIAFDVVSPNKMAQRPEKAVEVDSVGVEYLRRMIEECQNRNIEVMLTYLPFPASEEDWEEALYVEDIAREYEVSYINFLDLSVVDLAVDCSDKNSHLNGSGGRKVTAYIGKYIDEHYNIADHRGEGAYAGWEEDYRQYTRYKLDVMAQTETLDKYLMMLADPAFDCCIYVDGEAGIWRQNEMYMPLVENIAGERTEKLSQAVTSGGDYFLMVDNKRRGLNENVDGKQFSIETSFGNVHYGMDEKGNRTLFLQDGETDYFLKTSQGNNVAVQIVVINSADGSIAGIKRFGSGLSVYTQGDS